MTGAARQGLLHTALRTVAAAGLLLASLAHAARADDAAVAAVPAPAATTAAETASTPGAPASAASTALSADGMPAAMDGLPARMHAAPPLRLRGRRTPGTGTALPVTVAAPTAAAAALPPADPDLLALGASIYRDGIGMDGQPVHAERGGAELQGQEVACLRCHRASGMGSVEGEVRISPISGRYLFPLPGDVTMSVMDGHVGKQVNLRHAAYTEPTLTRALAAGVSVDDRPLSNVMPHFRLAPREVQALQAYLGQLSVKYSPGAEPNVIHLATVITPDVTPERRALFRTMMETALRGKNASTAPQHRYMASAAAFVTRSDRKWALEFWELTGTPDTWADQLDARYAANPPFALLSGLSGGQSWQPVHQFCNRHAVPCWFPSVAVPGDENGSGFNLYFSAGVRLEARVLADVLTETALPKGAHLIQVHTASVASTEAAQALRASLSPEVAQRILQTRLLPQLDQAALDRALQGVTARDRVVLWLEGPLPAGLKVRGAQPFHVSATLLGDPLKALPATWHARARVVYPYELPQKREANLAYLQTWLKQYNIPMQDEVLQSEVFFATNFFTDVVMDMLDNLYRDYLVERAEDMLGRRETGKAEQETRDRVTLTRYSRHAVTTAAALNIKASEAPDAQTAARVVFGYKESMGTTVYPHLNLGPRQRFASKGAYIVRLTDGLEPTLKVDHEWVTP